MRLVRNTVFVCALLCVVQAGFANLQVLKNQARQLVPSCQNYKLGPQPGFTHFVGEAFGGGVVFHVFKDAKGVEHGLIMAPNNIGPRNQPWSNISKVKCLPDYNDQSPDGLVNSNLIVKQEGHTISAASLCLDAQIAGFDDWYLPSMTEWDYFIKGVNIVVKAICDLPSADPYQKYQFSMGEHFWTSSEDDYDMVYAYVYYFDRQTGFVEKLKNDNYTGIKIRPIRKF